MMAEKEVNRKPDETHQSFLLYHYHLTPADRLRRTNFQRTHELSLSLNPSPGTVLLQHPYG